MNNGVTGALVSAVAVLLVTRLVEVFHAQRDRRRDLYAGWILAVLDVAGELSPRPTNMPKTADEVTEWYGRLDKAQKEASRLQEHILIFGKPATVIAMTRVATAVRYARQIKVGAIDKGLSEIGDLGDLDYFGNPPHIAEIYVLLNEFGERVRREQWARRIKPEKLREARDAVVVAQHARDSRQNLGIPRDPANKGR